MTETERSAVAVQERTGAVRFSVRVQPRASRSEITGVAEGALRVRLAAPPVDGEANEALVALLAHALGVATRAVRIVGGATGRRKMIEVDGVDGARVRGLAPS